ncbi:MAG: glycosyl hydrolase [Rikenellaceae bacterium]
MIKRENFTQLLLAIALLTTACTPSPTAQTPAQKLRSRIEEGINNKVIMLGHQDATFYGHTWKYEDNRSDVLELIGDYPAVMGYEIGAIELGKTESLDGVPFDLIRTEIQKQHSRGGINTISWHAYNPCGGDSWTEGEGVVTSILEGGANYDMFQKQLGIVANFLLSLKDESGELIPIIFRPWHEHDGNWFWWGEKWCTHDEYRRLWIMTYDFMAQRGLSESLVWCYMPGFKGMEAKMPPVEMYDMVGLDEYQKQSEERYLSGFNTKLEVLKEYSAKYGKPITISETGYESILDDDWWSTVLLPAIQDEPISYVLLWRNAWDKPEHFYCAYEGHSSAEDFKKFAASSKIATLKDIANQK